MRRTVTSLAFALSLSGCASDPPPQPVSEIVVIERLAVDPITTIGTLFLVSPDIRSAFDEIFENLSCRAQPVGLALWVRGEQGGLGTMGMYAVSPTSAVDLCAEGAEAFVQPLTFDATPEPSPLPTSERVPVVQGPVFIEGATVDARLPVGRFPFLNESDLLLLPEWWQVEARGGEGVDERIDLVEGEMSAAWSPRELHARIVVSTVEQAEALGWPIGATLLDGLAHEALGPDLDRDGDGLEEYLDTDGDGLIDLCRERRGIEVVGRDCPEADGFVDSYDLRLRFRVRRVAVPELTGG